MALMASKMVALGTMAPDFTLPDVVSGKPVSLVQLAVDRPLVLMFICNHCPYVKHINAELVRIANTYQARGVSFVAISSNDAVRYPEDGPERMKAVARELGYPFPYLYDQTQAVARDYEASCTPDFYLFDGQHQLRYRGRFDGATPGNEVPVTGEDLRAALDALLGGGLPNKKQRPSMGCGIKWA
jgi:peroxiredoxin